VLSNAGVCGGCVLSFRGGGKIQGTNTLCETKKTIINS